MGFGAKAYVLTKAAIDSVLGYDVDAHEGRHADSGADEIDADDLVAGADPRSTTALAAALAHKARHASGGDDAIAADDLVAGADPRSSSHASRHASGGDDEVTPAAIAAVAKSGAEEIAGVKTFTSTPVGPAADPTVDNQLARKAYVDTFSLTGWHQNWTEYVDQGGAIAPSILWDTDQVTFTCRDDADELRAYSDNEREPFAWYGLRMIVRLRRGVNAGGTVEAYVCLTSGDVDQKAVLATASFMGFKFLNNDLSAITGGGSGTTTTSLGVTLSNATWVEARYINPSRVEFYVHGVLKKVHTTNIPAAAPAAARMAYQVFGTFDGNRYLYSNKPALTFNHETDYITDLPTNQKVSGRVVRGQAGEELTIFQICYMKSDGKLWKAKADAAATMPALYMVTEALAADAYGTFLTEGYARNDAGWDWTVGGILYAFDDTAGAMIQTAPSDSGDQVQRVGIAVTADVVFFKGELTVVEIA